MDDISIWVILAQIINFAIIFFLFKYFLGEKIIKMIEERRKNLDKLNNVEAVLEEKKEEADIQAQKIIDEARKEAEQIKIDTKSLAKKEADLKIQQAQEKANSIIESTNKDIQKQKAMMENAMKETVIDVALKVNWKLFEDEKSNKEFIEKNVFNMLNKS